MTTPAFGQLSLAELRRRRSAKWRRYPPDVLPAWVAEMDFPAAEPVVAALTDLVRRSDFGYAYADELAATFAGWAGDHLKWTVEPGDVVAVPDVMAGVAAALALFTEPGDGVVVNTPVYPPFFAVLAETGRRLAEAPLVLNGRWELDWPAVEATFRAGARAYLLCNPHNPTGRMLSREELARVAELADRYGAFVIADEIHAPLAYPGQSHVPYGEVAGPGRWVVLSSASKGWNLPGLKCALVVAGSAEVRRELDRIPERIRYGVALPGVVASSAAFAAGGPWLATVLSTLEDNRRALADLLAARLPGVGYVPPQASYLAWLDCRALDLGDDPAGVFLERGRVALSAGPTFGTPGRGFARLNFATSRALLAEAVDRMATAVDT